MRQVQTDGHTVTLIATLRTPTGEGQSNNDCSDCRLLDAASRSVPQCRMDMEWRLKRSRSAKRIFRDVRQSHNKRFIRLKCIQRKLRFWFSRCEPKACVSANVSYSSVATCWRWSWRADPARVDGHPCTTWPSAAVARMFDSAVAVAGRSTAWRHEVELSPSPPALHGQKSWSILCG